MHTLKEVVSDRERLANFSHYIDGSMYYIVEVDGTVYQFPVNVSDENDDGTVVFYRDIRAITLMKYIRKAMDSGEFLLIKKP
jgi:hypothetical protein